MKLDKALKMMISANVPPEEDTRAHIEAVDDALYQLDYVHRFTYELYLDYPVNIEVVFWPAGLTAH